MDTKTGFNWRQVVKSGLIVGAAILLLSLVGLIEAANKRPIITNTLSMGHTILLIVLVMSGYMAVRQARREEEASPARLLASGTLASLTTSLPLGILVLVGGWIDLRGVFANASPGLYDLLTLKMGAGVGAVVPLILGTLAGLLTAALFLLPGAIRQAIGLGLTLVPLLAVLNSALFAGRGLSILGAIIVFVVGAGASYLRSLKGEVVKTYIERQPPARQRAIRLGTLGLGVLAILLLPLLGSYPSQVLALVGIFALMGLGLNIVVGFAGLLDLGYVAFFALGAYTFAVLSSPEIGWLGLKLGFWSALPFAIGVALLAGIILGIPVLGMRGDYLAIVTLGFGEIVRLVFLSDWLKPYVGGSNGITRIPKAAIGPLKFGTPQTIYYLILAGCLLVAFVALRLKDSRLGRAWMAMREDEDVAEATGINLVQTKLLAFATGAAFSGLGGAIFASMLTSVYPHSMDLLKSINALCIIIVGGIGSIPGAIVGALILVGLPELLREFAEYRMLMYGAMLVVMMLVRPEGFWPEATRRRELHQEADLVEPCDATASE
jgi:branched-chain amino acid transport system permease protein